MRSAGSDGGMSAVTQMAVVRVSAAQVAATKDEAKVKRRQDCCAHAVRPRLQGGGRRWQKDSRERRVGRTDGRQCPYRQRGFESSQANPVYPSRDEEWVQNGWLVARGFFVLLRRTGTGSSSYVFHEKVGLIAVFENAYAAHTKNSDD